MARDRMKIVLQLLVAYIYQLVVSTVRYAAIDKNAQDDEPGSESDELEIGAKEEAKARPFDVFHRERLGRFVFSHHGNSVYDLEWGIFVQADRLQLYQDLKIKKHDNPDYCEAKAYLAAFRRKIKEEKDWILQSWQDQWPNNWRCYQAAYLFPERRVKDDVSDKPSNKGVNQAEGTSGHASKGYTHEKDKS